MQNLKDTDDKIINILKQYSEVPDCPTDKFIDGFMANMHPKPKSRYGWGYGAIAASLIVGFGFFAYNSKPIEQIPVTNISTNTNTNISNDDAADEFATELLDYQDISS